MTAAQPVSITLRITDEEAAALAQFLKRQLLDDVLAKASTEDEAAAISRAIGWLRVELKEAGYDPR